ncbi:hypothetical protein [Nitrosopumilus sp.]|uniref:hypothetical protein n=1 Tax=Nitrosopumilus sp. TaxID=2024843 RepID=UPI003B5A67F4
MLFVVAVPMSFAQESTDNAPTKTPFDNKVTITPAPGSGALGCEQTSDGCYYPKTAFVEAGGIVVFKNTDTTAHTWTAGDPDGGPSGEFDTGLLMVDNSYKWKAETIGEIEYFCMVHPWMKGVIMVGEKYNDTPQPQQPPTSTEVDKLLMENKRMQNEITELKLENKELKNEINRLREQITSMSGEFIEMIKTQMEWFRGQISSK